MLIVGAARTAIGRFGGAVSTVPAHVLGATAIRGAMHRSGVDPATVDEVVMGQVGQVGPDAYGARRASLAAGLDVGVTAQSVNRLCASGLQAVWTATQMIRTGEASVVIAGGMESMSGQPFLSYDERSGSRLGNRTILDGALTLVTDPFGGYPMGETGERVADRFGIDRESQDAYALESQRRAAAAIRSGRFEAQIEPVEMAKGDPFQRDEHPRPDVTAARLASLPPVFRPEGTVTAGNSAGMNDGAAALILMSTEAASAAKHRPLGRVVAAAVTGIEPEFMGYAPVTAIARALQRAELRLGDIDVVELNEAFAAQTVAVIKGASLDPGRVNPNGGAIALGHPVGATGAILVVKLLAELERTGGRYGLCTMCIGGGQGMALIIERGID